MSGRTQLPLPLGHRPALGRDDFLVADHSAVALGWLDRWPDWPAPALLLWGPAGCGKTHLAHVFAAATGATILSCTPGLALDPPALLTAPAVVLDDADQGVDEVSLFHLYNAARDAGKSILLTARTPASRWAITLPDLRSRLQAAPAAEIGAPDDAVIAGVLVKQFTDRQIKIGAEVIDYLLRHMDRSFEAAHQTVAAADALSLAEKRPVTIPLLKRILQNQSASTDL